MFNNFSNQQQLIPMGIQQPPIVGMPIQNNSNNIPTYIPPMQNIPYANDSYISFSNQQTGKGFWDGFKTVFSKIGQFCTDNFGLIITGLGILGGYNFCSNSMKTYEENKKEGKLDDKGNLKNKDATIKENIMNFVGHGVHNMFGSSEKQEVQNTEQEEVKDADEDNKNNSPEKSAPPHLNDTYNFKVIRNHIDELAQDYKPILHSNKDINNNLNNYKTYPPCFGIIRATFMLLEDNKKLNIKPNTAKTIIGILKNALKDNDQYVRLIAYDIIKKTLSSEKPEKMSDDLWKDLLDLKIHYLDELDSLSTQKTD